VDNVSETARCNVSGYYHGVTTYTQNCKRDRKI
jgi:hypothetical protein